MHRECASVVDIETAVRTVLNRDCRVADCQALGIDDVDAGSVYYNG